MASLKQKVNNMQEDISKILKSQREILDRQDYLLKNINELSREQHLTQLEIGQLETKVDTRYFDLRMFILQKI